MDLPKTIYLVQPYPDTQDCEWCTDPAMYGTAKKDAVLYVRADVAIEALETSEKTKELMDYLREN